MARKCHCTFPKPTEWTKGKVVGSGSFGTVHLAMNKVTGSLFVVKSSESDLGIQFLENEARILRSLDSPYIVRCLGNDVKVGINGESKLSLFMEFMAGGSVCDVAEKFGGMLDEKVIRLYTKGILRGLKYLHDNGIVHSDLNCKNVLLGSCGDIKLADFGCAKRIQNDENKEGSKLSSWKTVGGTPLWMAPEVMRNEGFDFSVDIWSLGCTVIEMATGKAPWDGDFSNHMAAVLKIACSDELPKFPLNFSEEGLDFLAKCLERNPKKRWKAEELLEHSFVTWQSDWRKDDRESVSSPDTSLSPSSVLDIESFSGSDDDSGESPDGFGDFFRMIRCHQNDRKVLKPNKGTNKAWSSENWMIVR